MDDRHKERAGEMPPAKVENNVTRALSDSLPSHEVHYFHLMGRLFLASGEGSYRPQLPLFVYCMTSRWIKRSLGVASQASRHSLLVAGNAEKPQ